MVNLRDIAGRQKKIGELQRYSWERRRRSRRRRMVNLRDIAGEAEEEEEDW